jgi:hypothetical protein
MRRKSQYRAVLTSWFCARKKEMMSASRSAAEATTKMAASVLENRRCFRPFMIQGDQWSLLAEMSA